MVILYQIDIRKVNHTEYDVDSLLKENLEIDNDFAKNIVYGVFTHIKEIDSLANKYLKNWEIDRIDKIGAAILRIALCEFLYLDTPDVVIINEAIELAKKYCDDNVKNIINATLDQVIHNE